MIKMENLTMLVLVTNQIQFKTELANGKADQNALSAVQKVHLKIEFKYQFILM